MRKDVRAYCIRPIFAALTATLVLATTLTFTACEEKKKQDSTTPTPTETEAAATEKSVSSGSVKLLDTFTEKDGFRTWKFEYDKQNRIVKIEQTITSTDEVRVDTVKVTYSDDSVTVKNIYSNGSGDVKKYVKSGNSIISKEDTLTIDKDGFIVKSVEYWSKAYEYENGNLIGIKGRSLDDGSTSSHNYSYDDKNSPFSKSNTPKWLFHLLFLYKDNVFESKNNIILHSWESEMGGDCNHSYQYDSDSFPVTETTECYSDGNEDTIITHYIYSQPKATTFTDPRDNKTYKTAKIGSQTWLAENLNHETKNSKCYENNQANCGKYGRLYDWKAAKKACPSGWHLPSREEWGKLFHYADGTSGTKYPYQSETSSKNLRSKSSWEDNENGTDKFGFAALPAGTGSDKGKFNAVGSYAAWWSSTEWDNDDAHYRSTDYSFDADDVSGKGEYLSVRCIKD